MRGVPNCIFLTVGYMGVFFTRLVECAPIFGALVHNAPLSAL